MPSEDTTDETIDDAAVSPPVENTGTPTGEPEVDWKAHSRKHEREAKALRRQLDELQQAGMSEQEKAVAEAEERGRMTAAAAAGRSVAAASLRAAAAEAGLSLGSVVDLIDVGRFVATDGEVDLGGIGDAVSALAAVTKTTAPPAALTQGAQGGAKATPDFLADLFGG